MATVRVAATQAIRRLVSARKTLRSQLSQDRSSNTRRDNRHDVNRFMNKFRDLGFIQYNGDLRINTALLNIVLHD